MASFNVGGKNPINISDSHIEAIRARVAAGEDAEAVTREFFSNASADMQKNAYELNAQGLPTGAVLGNVLTPYGYDRNTSAQSYMSQFSSAYEPLLALIKGTPPPKQYAPGSLDPNSPNFTGKVKPGNSTTPTAPQTAAPASAPSQPQGNELNLRPGETLEQYTARATAHLRSQQAQPGQPRIPSPYGGTVPPLGTPEYTNYLIQQGSNLGMDLSQYKQNTSITPNSLASETPINLPTSNASISTAQGVSAGAGAMEKGVQDYINLLTPPETAKSREVDNLIESINKEIGNLEGRGQSQLDEEAARGVEQKKQTLVTAQNKLRTKQAEYEAIKANFDRLNAEIEGKPITMDSIIGSQAQVRRVAGAELNVKASEISMIQAEVLAAQGDLSSAQESANRAVDLKYQDAEDLVNIKLKQLELLEGQLTKEEQVRSDAIKLFLNDQQTQIADQKALEKDKNTTLLNLMQQYPDAGISTSDSLESANSKVTRNSKIYQSEIRLVEDGTTDTEADSRAGDQLSFLRNTIASAKQLSSAAGASGVTRFLGDTFVGDTRFRQLEALTNTLRTNVLTLMTDPDIKKFFGPQMSEADVRLMTAAGTTLNPQQQKPEQLVSELTRLDNLLQRMQSAVSNGGGGTTITAPNGETIILTD